VKSPLSLPFHPLNFSPSSTASPNQTTIHSPHFLQNAEMHIHHPLFLFTLIHITVATSTTDRERYRNVNTGSTASETGSEKSGDSERVRVPARRGTSRLRAVGYQAGNIYTLIGIYVTLKPLKPPHRQKTR